MTDPSELGQAAFRYARPDFHQKIGLGQDVVVAGWGWGCGSSREQAVWALKSSGVKAIIARSIGFIHKRNLVNEGLPFAICTSPDFYSLAKEGDSIELRLDEEAVTVGGRTFRTAPVPVIFQRIGSQGGIVDLVRVQGSNSLDYLAGIAKDL